MPWLAFASPSYQKLLLLRPVNKKGNSHDDDDLFCVCPNLTVCPPDRVMRQT